MKYFKPNLLAECRSSNPDIAEAAAAKWQKNAEAYRKHLREIRDRLPSSVRSFMHSVTLHDARLLSINLAQQPDRTRFFLSFQLAGRHSRAGVQLCYNVFKGLDVALHEPDTHNDTIMFALYDEFDVSKDGFLTHSILMTGGIEFRLRCAKLLVTYFTHVVAPGRGETNIKQQLKEMEVSA